MRPDIRVVITTLLGTEWMIDQLQEKVNESDPLPFSWSHEKYVGDTRNFIPYYDKGAINKDSTMSVPALMRFMGSDSTQVQGQNGDPLNYFPTKNRICRLEDAAVLRSGAVPLADSASIRTGSAFSSPAMTC